MLWSFHEMKINKKDLVETKSGNKKPNAKALNMIAYLSVRIIKDSLN
jgi:hypothetical protein